MTSHPLDGFRDPARLQPVVDKLHSLAGDRDLTFMHVCGTHENAIARHGLRRLLPPGVRVIAGPGCPVCVCPPTDIQQAVDLALDHGCVVCTFGDMMRVPGRLSLEQARARGGDIRVVLGAHEAVRIARDEPDRQVVMLAVGFETTACTVAAAALADPPANFTLLLAHRLIPPALDALLATEDLALHGFLMPGHVLTVTGLRPYAPFCARTRLPAVVAGFEPLDVLAGLQHLVRLAVAGRGETFNAYPRAVRPDGNPAAQAALERAFRPTAARWRGLGTIEDSGLALQEGLEHLDAAARHGVRPDPDLPDDLPGCRCGDVMLGRIEPADCALFGTVCTPDGPRGPCMVSFEGTCRNRFLFPEA